MCTTSECGGHKMMKSWGLLALRLAVGIIFMYMGYSKLVTNHAQATALMAGILGGSGSGLAYFVGLLELVGGAMVLLGVFATYAAVWLSIIMVVAILAVHMGGPAIGYFLPLSVLGSCLAIIGCGAGKFRLVKRQCHCRDCKMGCGMNGGACGNGGSSCCGGSGACGDKMMGGKCGCKSCCGGNCPCGMPNGACACCKK